MKTEQEVRSGSPLSKTTMETQSGRFIDLIDLSPAMIDPEDIAYGLARLPRYLGQTISPIPYSVAQHSVLMSRAIGNTHGVAVWALLHDAHESYIGDWPRPLQQAIAWYSELARRALAMVRENLDEAIGERFSLHVTSEEREMVDGLDVEMLAIEAEWLMRSKGENWGLPERARRGTRIVWDGVVWDHDLAQAKFLARMRELGILGANDSDARLSRGVGQAAGGSLP